MRPASTFLLIQLSNSRVVMGNPARVKRLRVKEEWIDDLNELKWWNLPADVIKANFELFHTDLTYDVIQKMKEVCAIL